MSDTDPLAAARAALALLDAPPVPWAEWLVRCEYGHDLAGRMDRPWERGEYEDFPCIDCGDEVEERHNFVKALQGVRPPDGRPTLDEVREHLRVALDAIGRLQAERDASAVALRRHEEKTGEEIAHWRARAVAAEGAELDAASEHLWWVRDTAEEGAACYRGATAAEAWERAAADFGEDPAEDPSDTYAIEPVTELDVGGLQEEIAHWRERAERAEELLRWRPVSGAPPVGEPVETAAPGFHGWDTWEGEDWRTGFARWTHWRPRTPGPEADEPTEDCGPGGEG